MNSRDDLQWRAKQLRSARLRGETVRRSPDLTVLPGLLAAARGCVQEFATNGSLHPQCTRSGRAARLALEIILWTGQRRGDAHRFGPHVRDGRINYEQEKGGKELWLPIAPQLRAAIDAMPAVGVQTFLVTEHGKPFTKGGFGNWFRDRCDEAGLKHCTAHGLRKAIARRLADNGATQKMIKSVGGWSNDREVAIYTAGADQAELARTALAEWEAQALTQGVASSHLARRLLHQGQ